MPLEGGVLPARVTPNWDAGELLSAGAAAHAQLVWLVCGSVSVGRATVQWVVLFSAGGSLQGFGDPTAALESLPGLHPSLGHVTLF